MSGTAQAGSLPPRQPEPEEAWSVRGGAWSVISLPSASLATGHRPLCRAGRPSRDLGFLLVSPLELWLCFRPSAPAVSDLSSCVSRLCFDFKLALFGAFWGVVTSPGRHCPTPSPCPGWPAACAPSWDKIPILSFDESSMTRLESCPTIGPELPSVIGSLRCPSSQPPAPTSHCSSPIFSSPPATWSSPSATWHSSFAISHSSSVARHPPSAIPRSPFRIPTSSFPIPKSAFRILRGWAVSIRSPRSMASDSRAVWLTSSRSMAFCGYTSLTYCWVRSSSCLESS